jgi:hypothetical protein
MRWRGFPPARPRPAVGRRMLRLAWWGRYQPGRHHRAGPSGRHRGFRWSRRFDRLHRMGRRCMSTGTNGLATRRQGTPRENQARPRWPPQRSGEGGRRPDRAAGQAGGAVDEGRGVMLHPAVCGPPGEREAAPHERREPAARLRARLGRPDPSRLRGPVPLSLPRERRVGGQRGARGALGASRTGGCVLLHPVDDGGVRRVRRLGPSESMRRGRQETRAGPPPRAKPDQGATGNRRSRPRAGPRSPHAKAGREPERCIERPVSPCRRHQLSHGHVAPRFSSSMRSTSSPTYSCRSDGVRARMSRQDQCRWYAR